MIITHDPTFKLTLHPGHADGRSKGLHLSEVIADLHYRMFKPKYGAPGTEEIDPGYAYRGFMFERMMSHSLAEEFAQGEMIMQKELTYQIDPGPGLRDFPLYSTFDGWIWDKNILVETKATEKSLSKMDPQTLSPGQLCTNFQENYRTWDWQIQGYLKQLQSLTCHLVVYFVRGNYKFDGPRGGDCVKRYILTYSQTEIDETWRMLINHARTMIRDRGLAK